MKKILLLGGSEQQVITIDTVKKLGYYTILCDYLPDNSGQYHADKFYQVSATDMNAVLTVAKENGIDGVYQTIEFDDEIEKYIIKKCLYKKSGDEVHYFDNVAKALGIVFIKFECKEDMQRMLSNINNYIHVKLVGGYSRLTSYTTISPFVGLNGGLAA